MHLNAKDMKDELDTRRQFYLPKFGYPPELPICAYREEILAAIRRSAAVVVCGDTGSGKTTQLPKMLLELGCGAKGRRIACTQPRRLAAVTVAERVAAEIERVEVALAPHRPRRHARRSADPFPLEAGNDVLEGILHRPSSSSSWWW